MLFHFHKVADDTQGREVLRELEADGVDTSFMAVIFSHFQSSLFPFLHYSGLILLDSLSNNKKNTRTKL